MAPLPRMNHKFVVNFIVSETCTTKQDFESYEERRQQEKKKKYIAGQNLDLSALPSDLLAYILKGLSSADRIRFGATSKQNLSLVITTTTTTNNHDHTSPRYEFRTIDKLPWRATFTHLSDSVKFSLFEPLHRRGNPDYATYEIHEEDPEGDEAVCGGYTSEIKASKKGWLLFLWSKQEEGLTWFLLFSPFSKRIINLPRLDNSLEDLRTCKATFSSDPSSPDCVYFFLSQYVMPGRTRVSTLHQRSRKWKTKVFDDERISFVSSVVYHDGSFYCLSYLGQLSAYDVVGQSWKVIIRSSPIYNCNPRITYPSFHILVCEGKLLLAFVETHPPEQGHKTNCCGLFEFSSSARTWVQRTSLGNHALFLQRGCTSFAVPVSPWSSCDNDIANRMYFYTSCHGEVQLMYYSFKDNRRHTPKDSGYWSSNDVKGRIWIEPPFPPCEVA